MWSPKGKLARLAAVAQSMGKIAPVSLRINPDSIQDAPYVATGLRESKSIPSSTPALSTV